MSKSPTPTHTGVTDPEPPIVLTDDGGSGLLEACRARFASPGYVVECDARHTVWVRRTEGTHSVGLPPWVLRGRSLSGVLEDVEAKLAPALARH